MGKCPRQVFHHRLNVYTCHCVSLMYQLGHTPEQTGLEIYKDFTMEICLVQHIVSSQQQLFSMPHQLLSPPQPLYVPGSRQKRVCDVCYKLKVKCIASAHFLLAKTNRVDTLS